MTVRKPRPAARLLILDEAERLLLFRYCFDDFVFWITPGGACEPGEEFPATARRELNEETGLDLDPGPEVARRTAEYKDWEGRDVWSDERYFLIRTCNFAPDWSGLMDQERKVLTDYQWAERTQLADWHEQLFPIDLADLWLDSLKFQN